MVFDIGVISKLEDWFVTKLIPLKDDGKKVFKTVAAWEWQTESGTESFTGFEPFAFISYFPANPDRAGDYDLLDKMRFIILIGIESKKKGVARRGNANNLGYSRIRELVVDAVEKEAPGFGCDEFYSTGETELVDQPKRYAAVLTFTANRIVLEL